MTEQYIWRYEIGKVRWPSSDYRAALCAVLGASNPTELGFTQAEAVDEADADLGETQVAVTEGDEAVDRREFLVGALVVPSFLATGAARTPVPAAVGAADVEQVQTMAVAFSRAGDAVGAGGLARQAVLAQLDHAAAMLEANIDSDLRPELQSAVSYTAVVAGFGAVDLGAYAEATRLLRYGESLAEEASNWSLRAEAIACRVRAAIWAGLPNEAWTLAESALIRPDLLGAVDKAMIHGVKARALSLMDGREREALREVELADHFFSQVDPSSPLPDWLHYYTQAEHDAVLADALSGIAFGDPKVVEQASARYGGSVDLFGPAYRRSAAMAALGNTRLHLVAGDRDLAAELGHDAMRRAGEVRSQRTDTMVRDVRHLADEAGMSDLRDHAAEMVPPESA